MGAGRKKAMECLPAFKREFEKPDTSMYVFIALLPAKVDRDSYEFGL
jgi:hypothetical protein